MSEIVIIGGGFGGLSFLKAARKSSNNFTIIDKTNHHLFQPLLYQVATAVLSPADITVPIRNLFKNDKNVNVVLDEVIDINQQTNSLLLKSGNEINYDTLLISVGSSYSYFGNDNWSSHSHGLKNLNDALDIRDNILKAFEKAESEKNLELKLSYLNFVIVGGGPTGVELAGSIAELAYKNIKNEYRNFNTSDINVYLVEGGPDILPDYSRDLSDKASKYLQKLGVTLRLNEKVMDIEDKKVTTEKETYLTNNIIWAAGNKANPLIDKLKTEVDNLGRVIVNDDFSIIENNSIYVIGDASNYKNFDGKPLPGIAPVAIQQGKYLAKKITSNKSSESVKKFKYKDKGMMATIGGFKAIGVIGKLKISGLLAWLFWSLIHLVYLIGYKSKLIVLIEWIFAYFLNKRGTRLIYRENIKNNSNN
ncbi:MAG: NAD(P)/FAD-dependent oxidoreductase [Candidatus Actinomarinales bacterium]|nr:NAD(P)/FAD-dependent oxidoreductase [Candidatus Actinomarinales bacterium]|tara:strand:+ start:718 stop:1977 length:1260 start_codon:yes stop_codon:yes gene_type:complete